MVFKHHLIEAVVRYAIHSIETHVYRVPFRHPPLAAGIYLPLMALAGYFIQYLAGSWGSVLQICFLFAPSLLLLV